MRLGAIVPQTDIGNDPAFIRDFAQACEGAGYQHLLAYDHVVGSTLERFDQDRPGFRPPYTDKTPFHEIFVLMGFFASVTTSIELVTGIVILPQRQTVLAAKQAASVDVLSNGRFRFGIGTGWNHTEYEALGENFHNRGRRQEEQVEVMRRLWSEDVVTFDGRWHKLDRVGINPRPPRGTIPVWFGGSDDRLLERTGRLGDGWFPLLGASEATTMAIETIHDAARDAGRDPAAIGIEGRVSVATGTQAEWMEELKVWTDMNASHVSVNTMRGAFTTPQQHLNALLDFKKLYDNRS